MTTMKTNSEDNDDRFHTALVVFAPESEANAALEAMRSVKAGKNAAIIGHAKSGIAGRVEMKTIFGGARIVEMLVGEQLPRIC